MPDPQIKNLIFDLGGVILDLSVDTSLQAFADLSGIDKIKASQLYFNTKGFETYEKGLMDDQTFRDFVRDVYKISHSDAEIDRSWTAMLLGIPKKKLELLLRLKNQYQVFLLSNTNSIHIDYINKNMVPIEAISLDRYFHKAYYSHVMNKRKPDAEIFEQVLNENNILPEQTLFLDDYLINIEGAKALGIQTVQVTTPDFILDYFHG